VWAAIGIVIVAVAFVVGVAIKIAVAKWKMYVFRRLKSKL